MPLRSITYLDGRELEHNCEALMKFRLTYSGPLLSSRAAKNPNDPNERDRRAAHKHNIRRCFHKQLKALWESNRFLSSHTMDRASLVLLPDSAKHIWEADPSRRLPMSEVLGEAYSLNGYKYAPLVRAEISLFCSLRILCLRRDGMDAVLPGRDIDNRIKTVVDALAMPTPQQGPPLSLSGKKLRPQAGEKPFYVLLDDDRQVTHLEVEVDTLLQAPPRTDDSYVHLTVSVEIRPYNVNLFNLSFA